MIVKACLNGARQTSEHPALPTTPSQLAADAAVAHSAGVDAIHVHVKDPAGRDTLDADRLTETLDAIRRAATGLAIGVTTGAWIHHDPDERIAAIRKWDVLPDFASVNWHEDGADGVAAALLDRGIGVEAGLWNAEAVAKRSHSPHCTQCLRVLIELPAESDRSKTSRLAEEMLDTVAEANETRLPVLLHGEGDSAWDAVAIAAQRGLSTRIGLEDTLVLPDRRTTPGNGALIAAALRMINGASEAVP